MNEVLKSHLTAIVFNELLSQDLLSMFEPILFYFNQHFVIYALKLIHPLFFYL